MEIQNQDMLFKEESYEIVGACFEVHNHLGSGFTEPSYQEALEIELSSRGIPFKSQVELPIFYKDTKLKHGFRADFLCHESIIVEIKAVSALLPSTARKSTTTSTLDAINSASSSTSPPSRAYNTSASHSPAPRRLNPLISPSAKNEHSIFTFIY